MTNPETHKVKAIDINTESLKLYTTIAVASIAGLIAYHNSSAIVHNETTFVIALISFILSALTSVTTLNYYIISVNNNEFEVTARLPVWLNRIAIFFFVIGLITAGTYLGISKNKQKAEYPVREVNGILIDGNKIEIGNDVKTHIKITKDSTGNIREIIIPKVEE